MSTQPVYDAITEEAWRRSTFFLGALSVVAIVVILVV